MLKRRRRDSDPDSILEKRPHYSPDVATRRRRSRRLQQKDKNLCASSQSHLPSPTPTTEQKEKQTRKRKSIIEEPQQRKKRRISQSEEHSVCSRIHPDRTTYWVNEDAQLPPPDYFSSSSMSSRKSGNKRVRDDSTSRSTRVSERYARLMENGVSMDDTDKMNESGQRICDELLPSGSDSRPPARYPNYDECHRSAVLRRAATAPEAIIQRDILPTVIPSVQNLDLLKLDFFKDIELDLFVDEINAEWTRVTTMGGSNPKPDYVAGLCRRVFSTAIWDTLMRYASADTPVLLSPEMCFPLLIGEAKRGSNGIQQALLQAAHAAAIAIRSQISLCRAAYGDSHEKTTELYGQPLVFSVCHNHEEVHILAHFALTEHNKLHFYYQKLEIITLTRHGGRDRDVPNTFVENVYKKIIPLHVSRLRAAAKKLHEKEGKDKEEEAIREREAALQKEKEKQTDVETALYRSTGISFDASHPGLDEHYTNLGLEDSQDSQDPAVVFKKPSLPESARAAKELAQIRELMITQAAEFKHREEKLERQLEQQSMQISHLLLLLGPKE